MPAVSNGGIGIGQLSSRPRNELSVPFFRSIGKEVIIPFYEMNEDETFKEGTTVELLIMTCIERLKELHYRFQSTENRMAVLKLEEAITWLDMRREDRIKRGVEGKHIK